MLEIKHLLNGKAVSCIPCRNFSLKLHGQKLEIKPGKMCTDSEIWWKCCHNAEVMDSLLCHQLRRQKQGRVILPGGIQNISKIRKNYLRTHLSQKSGKELNSHCLANAEKHPLFSCCISQVIRCVTVVIAQMAGLQMREQKSELEAKVLEISHNREHMTA